MSEIFQSVFVCASKKIKKRHGRVNYPYPPLCDLLVSISESFWDDNVDLTLVIVDRNTVCSCQMTDMFSKQNKENTRTMAL